MARLQLARAVLLFVCVADGVASTLLMTRVSDILAVKDIIVNQVS